MRQSVENIGVEEIANSPAITALFGEVLAKRRKERESDCFIFRLLHPGLSHELSALEGDCNVYIRELGLQEAQKKCRHEIKGFVSRPRREFDGRCGDFWAEIAAVRALSQDNFHGFRPLPNTQNGIRVSDYAAKRNNIPAFIEVKNIHANETLLDVFTREIAEAYEAEPSAYRFHLMVDYPFDKAPTREQERLIRQFIRELKAKTPPFRKKLDLITSSADIDVTAGSGTAHLCRLVGGESPEPIDEEWLLKKVRNKAEEAVGQMRVSRDLRVLVVNVDTTTAMLSLDFVRKAKAEIREVFREDVEPYILHFRHPTTVAS